MNKKINPKNNEITNRILLKTFRSNEDLNLYQDENSSGESNIINLHKMSEIYNANWFLTAEKPITSHRKVLGNFIVFVKKIIRKITLRWYVNPITSQQTVFNSSIASSMNEIIKKLEENDKVLIEMSNKIAEQEEQNKYSILQLEQSFVRQYKTYVEGQIESTKADIESTKADIESTKADIESSIKIDIETLKQYSLTSENTNNLINEKLNKLIAEFTSNSSITHNHIAQFHDIIHQIQRNLHGEIGVLSNRLRRIERKYTNSIDDHSEEKTVSTNEKNKADNNEKLDFDYYLFEERFRGPFEVIKKRQAIYLEYFAGKSNILDVGCGRGEFLELLTENNISCVGIDINKDMVDASKERGFDVYQMDLFSYLSEVPDNSLGGMFLSHVIEHLTPHQLTRFIELSYKKLSPTSYLIMETPNPTSLYIYANSFYQDLTHVKPVHPGTLRFMAECIGYRDLKIEFLAPVDNNTILQRVEIPGLPSGSLDAINENFEKINKLVYNYQDYVLIAKK
ncbi:hypothetical protein AV654_06280 [Paenibacillus elgii]|uniref:Uncharacterized protein n=1 Tax=Paenibacillus elgii TaxID=189691 RepID=A0A161RYJ8_9BACL|nr:class I SAM-dependent methyltransferase [Paenibacillus elgii]KZE70488.1 hypothetical protein AV654_06280 [Paenibacillus elgii]